MLELEALNRAFDNNMSAVEPFSLKLERIGVFRKPRILWIGLRTPEPTLLQLVDYINDIAETVLPGRIARHGSFTPHVSLFRGINAIPDDAPDEVVAWRVSDFTLVESIPNICGVEYRVLRHWMLEQQGPGA